MPIYEYKCSACSHEHEALRKFSDAPLVTCPACGKDTLTKLVSAAGFQLKGSGWYQTDFRSSGAKPAVKPDAAKADAGSSDSSKAATSAEGGKAGDSAGSKTSEGKATTPAVSTATPASTGSTPAST